MIFARSYLKEGGFTLIELLVVIAIIGMLSSIVLASLGNARSKARDVQRRSDLKQIANALEIYYNTNGSYPSTATLWRGMCTTYNNGCNGGGAGSCTTGGASGYIPNLAPTYISQLPRDPQEVSPNKCYLYDSNGKDYKVMAYLTVESSVSTTDTMYDPNNPTRLNTYTLYTPGAAAW